MVSTVASMASAMSLTRRLLASWLRRIVGSLTNEIPTSSSCSTPASFLGWLCAEVTAPEPFELRVEQLGEGGPRTSAERRVLANRELFRRWREHPERDPDSIAVLQDKSCGT